MHLLVFDDEEAIGRLIVRVATMAGLSAIAVADVASFQQSLANAPPQVIVLDLQLGATDGVEQLRYLAQQHYTGSIILMSGFDSRVLSASTTVAKNLGLKVVATLPKPVEIAELEAILKQSVSVPELLTVDGLLMAIQNDELSLDFQPIVTCNARSLNKLEALVRWEHPTLGQIPPGDFLPLAETRREVIDALTDWVIGAAIDAWQVLREVGFAVPIAVNVSPLNLHDLTLPDRIARRLAEAGMPTEQLCLEITESTASQDLPRMMDILTRIRLKGIELAIDDFGTGYSSLKALRQLPFSVIKIDRSFVADLMTSADSLAIVKSIIGLAANMNMSTIAEGVETEETARLLEQMNVGALQGYLIGRPMPVEAVPSWSAIWNRSNAKAGRPLPGTSDAQPVTIKPTDDTPQLTTRQIDVLRLLAQGFSVKEIARHLGLGIGTIKVHLSNAYSALGARNRIEAITRLGPLLTQPT